MKLDKRYEGKRHANMPVHSLWPLAISHTSNAEKPWEKYMDVRGGRAEWGAGRQTGPQTGGEADRSHVAGFCRQLCVSSGQTLPWDQRWQVEVFDWAWDAKQGRMMIRISLSAAYVWFAYIPEPGWGGGAEVKLKLWGFSLWQREALPSCMCFIIIWKWANLSVRSKNPVSALHSFA